MGRGLLRRCFGWSFCICILLFPATGSAQDNTALKAELDKVYERLLQDPSNRELNQRLISLAMELKDYDAAIGGVERLIFYEPDNADLQLEAARLYLQIGSYAVARGYLNTALALPGASADVKQEATKLLGQVAQGERPSPWGFFGQAGLRYQTNANIGPEFLDPNTENTFVGPPEKDWNTFGLGTLAYASQHGNVILESQLSAYYADQFKVDRLDLGFGELTAGPRFITDDGAFSLKPYGIVQGILLGSDPYETALGGGTLARLTVADGWWIEPQFEYKNREYYNSDDYGDATNQNGNLYSYSADGSGQFSEDFSWLSRVAFNQNDARTDHNSYDQYYASLGIRMGFDVFEWTGWAFSPFASVSLTQYKGLAPQEVFTGFNIIREDFQWNAGATLEIPLHENLGVNVQVQYTHNDSNLSRYTYQNLQVTSGPTLRF